MMMVLLLLFFESAFAVIPFGFSGAGDPCPGAGTLGAVCRGGGIYAGSFDGGKYMITPGNCTDSATPSCDGAADSLYKIWRGSSGSDVDIPGITNISVSATNSSSAERGHVTTPLITAHASISSDSAADYCENMNFGGFNDWYLPSKAELIYLYCKAAGVPNHNPGFYPQTDVNCAGLGGKTYELPGFNATTNNYWSSTEGSSTTGNYVYFDDGFTGTLVKSNFALVRCVRRY